MNTTYWRESELIYICALSAHEIENDQDYIALAENLFSFQEARVAINKFRHYHCPSFDDATIMTLILIDTMDTEPTESFKVAIYMPHMHISHHVRGHECKVESSITPHQKYSS